MQVFVETDRLILRRFTTADADHLVDLDRDPEVMRFLSGGVPTPRSMIEHEILPRILREYDELEGLGAWAVVEKDTSRFVVWVALRPVGGHPSSEATLGYRLRRSVWGRGYATEAARAVLSQGFSELRLRRVSATTYQDNAASHRVMEKIGMSLVRRYRMTPEELGAEPSHVSDPTDLWDGYDVEYAIQG